MVMENATAITEYLYDVFYDRACGGVLTSISGSDLDHSVTLIANVAGYLTMFKDFVTLNKKISWWISDPYFLAMSRLGNLCASHLQHS